MAAPFATDGSLVSEHFEPETSYAVCFLQRGSASSPSLSFKVKDEVVRYIHAMATDPAADPKTEK